MPILRWMRQTESSTPSLSRASFQASTCWYTLSTSVPSRSNRNTGSMRIDLFSSGGAPLGAGGANEAGQDDGASA